MMRIENLTLFIESFCHDGKEHHRKQRELVSNRISRTFVSSDNFAQVLMYYKSSSSSRTHFLDAHSVASHLVKQTEAHILI